MDSKNIFDFIQADAEGRLGSAGIPGAPGAPGAPGQAGPIDGGPYIAFSVPAGIGVAGPFNTYHAADSVGTPTSSDNSEGVPPVAHVIRRLLGLPEITRGEYIEAVDLAVRAVMEARERPDILEHVASTLAEIAIGASIQHSYAITNIASTVNQRSQFRAIAEGLRTVVNGYVPMLQKTFFILRDFEQDAWCPVCFGPIEAGLHQCLRCQAEDKIQELTNELADLKKAMKMQKELHTEELERLVPSKRTKEALLRHALVTGEDYEDLRRIVDADVRASRSVLDNPDAQEWVTERRNWLEHGKAVVTARSAQATNNSPTVGDSSVETTQPGQDCHVNMTTAGEPQRIATGPGIVPQEVRDFLEGLKMPGEGAIGLVGYEEAAPSSSLGALAWGGPASGEFGSEVPTEVTSATADPDSPNEPDSTQPYDLAADVKGLDVTPLFEPDRWHNNDGSVAKSEEPVAETDGPGPSDGLGSGYEAVEGAEGDDPNFNPLGGNYP